MKIYNIVFCVKGEKIENTCTELTLHNALQKFIDIDGEDIHIIKKNKIEREENIKTTEDIEKMKYYRSQYNKYYKKYRDKKIGIRQYKKAKKVLKELIRKCETKEEFKNRFIEYQNNEKNNKYKKKKIN